MTVKVLLTPDRRGVIVCRHILEKSSPLLQGMRGDSVEEADSGWCFVCPQNHNDVDLKLLSIEELVVAEPSLASVIDLPPGSVIFRQNNNSHWIVEKV